MAKAPAPKEAIFAHFPNPIDGAAAGPLLIGVLPSPLAIPPPTALPVIDASKFLTRPPAIIIPIFGKNDNPIPKRPLNTAEMSPFKMPRSIFRRAKDLMPPPAPEKKLLMKGLTVSVTLFLSFPNSFLVIFFPLFAILFLYSSASCLFFSFVVLKSSSITSFIASKSLLI